MIAVDISERPKLARLRDTIDVLMQTFVIMGRTIASQELTRADIVVVPDIANLNSANFDSRNYAIIEGERAGLADYEVVELLLTLAVPRSDVKQPAKRLLQRFGTLRGILDAPLKELREIDGVGLVTPVALQIIRAAATLYLQQAAANALNPLPREILRP